MNGITRLFIGELKARLLLPSCGTIVIGSPAPCPSRAKPPWEGMFHISSTDFQKLLIILPYLFLLPEKTHFLFIKSGTIPDLGSGEGGLGLMFTENLNKRVAQKLRIIILLHFGLVSLQLIFPRPTNSSSLGF